MNKLSGTHTLLNVKIKNQSFETILDKIKKHIHVAYSFFHIVSLNPENIMTSMSDEDFRVILSEADIQLIDGIAVALGCDFLKIPHGRRLTGADFMNDLVKMGYENGLRIMLLGGYGNLAKKVRDCYTKKYPNIDIFALTGFSDIKASKEDDYEALFTKVAAYKPQIIISAFGSPHQEKLFYDNRALLKGVICMGVGGGFEFVAEIIPRAPVWMRQVGLEWLFRLIIQPWRWRRQIKIIEYFFRVILWKLRSSKP